ncbi:MAG: hypothetical protein NZ521_05660 [Flammeovirgaceae bacterium]|nr:hypothetical protein [Flammeovirgaceae bacterium]MDW8287190.1 hypothetical protein [Flammeovirgaceae bacterium]
MKKYATIGIAFLMVIHYLTHAQPPSSQGTYKGKYRNGMPHGQGKYTWTDGSVYEGDFSYGKISGWGTFKSVDGDVYEGYWYDGKKEGYGTFRWKNGDEYKGYFKNDLREGKGIFVAKNGERYEGEWKNDLAHGKGEYYWANGSKYIGEWKEGKMHGQGILLYANGDIEQGTFKEGKFVPCNCLRQSLTVEEAHKEADAVFYGKVVSINTSKGYDAVEFQVERHWKGKLYPQRRIYLKAEYTSCDHIFFEGNSYLVYAKSEGADTYRADKCSRTVSLDHLQKDLEILAKMPCEGEKTSIQSYSVEESPVCGCNGKSYKNPYEAERSGVKHWKSGWCEEKSK